MLSGKLPYQSPRSVCVNLGGKFASAQGRCVSRFGYWSGDCGHWAYPSSWRRRIEPGAPIASVYFRLGHSNRIDGENYFWSYGKGSDQEFHAIIRDGRLVELDRE